MRPIFLFFCISLSTSVSSAQNLNTSDLREYRRSHQEGKIQDDFISAYTPEDLVSTQFLSEDDRLDSTYYWTWDTNLLDWQLLTRSFFTSDENNNILSELTLVWDGLQWVNQSLNSYTYDQYNNLIQDIYQIWNGTAWYNNTQIIYTYDINIDKINELNQNWDGVTWVNTLQQVFTYDNNHFVITNTAQHWTGTAWQDVFLRTYTYDDFHNVVLQVIQNWNSGWVNNQQVIYSYDIDHDLTMNLNQRWVTDHWEDNYRHTYMYDANHNRVLVLRQDPAGVNIWVDVERFIYGYDIYNSLLSQLYQTYLNDTWVNNYQFLVTNDLNLNRTSILFQIWDEQWVNQDTTHYYYTFSTGIEGLTRNEKGISLYPNPATHSLHIITDEDYVEDITVKIFTNTGVEVMESKISPLRVKSVDISSLLPGIYLAIIQTEKGLRRTSFVKQ